MLLGADIPDPGDWPSTHAEVSSVDHDGDGYPGVTSFAAMGPGYSNPNWRIKPKPPRQSDFPVFGTSLASTACSRVAKQLRATHPSPSIRALYLTPDGQECNRSQTAYSITTCLSLRLAQPTVLKDWRPVRIVTFAPACPRLKSSTGAGVTVGGKLLDMGTFVLVTSSLTARLMVSVESLSILS